MVNITPLCVLTSFLSAIITVFARPPIVQIARSPTCSSLKCLLTVVSRQRSETRALQATGGRWEFLAQRSI